MYKTKSSARTSKGAWVKSPQSLECFLIYTSWDLITNTNTDCPRVLADDKDQQKTWSPSQEYWVQQIGWNSEVIRSRNMLLIWWWWYTCNAHCVVGVAGLHFALIPLTWWYIKLNFWFPWHLKSQMIKVKIKTYLISTFPQPPQINQHYFLHTLHTSICIF